MRRLGEKRLKIISVLSVCGKKTFCEINLSKITFRYGNEHNINFWYFLYKFLQLEVFFFNFNKEEEHDTIQVLPSTLNSRNSLKFRYVREEHVHRRPEKIG